MNLPFDIKPFPIPVVALGAGSQTEDDTLDYINMPQGMATYRAPVLPEPEQIAGQHGAVAALEQVLAMLQALRRGEPAAPVSLHGLSPAERHLIHQVLGEGEVCAQVLAAPGQLDAPAATSIQESVFAGIWRVVGQDEAGRPIDHIEVGAIPAVLLQAAQADSRPAAPPLPVLPAGVLNAPAILAELAEHRQHWPLRRARGERAEVVNLTLLPLSLEDIAYLDHQLGTGRVLILSRGYGNCRITNSCVAHTWRLVYYNSQDNVILNSVEVTDIPEVACAAPEDLADSEERLAEVLQWVREV